MNLVTLRTYLMFMSFVVVLASTYSCMNAIKEEIFNRREGLTFSFFFSGWKNIFAKYTSNKELLSKLHKDPLKCNNTTKQNKR